MYFENFINHFFRVKKKFSSYHDKPNPDDIVLITSIHDVACNAVFKERVINVTFVNLDLKIQEQYFYAYDLTTYFEALE